MSLLVAFLVLLCYYSKHVDTVQEIEQWTLNVFDEVQLLQPGWIVESGYDDNELSSNQSLIIHKNGLEDYLEYDKASDDTSNNEEGEDQQEDPEKPADQRGEKGKLKRPRALAVLRHFVAVQRCGDVRRGAGNFQQNRADGPARHRGRIGRAKQDQAMHRRKVERERDQERHRHRRRQARRCAKDQPADGAAHQKRQRNGRRHFAEIVEKLHITPSSPLFRQRR